MNISLLYVLRGASRLSCWSDRLAFRLPLEPDRTLSIRIGFRLVLPQ